MVLVELVADVVGVIVNVRVRVMMVVFVRMILVVRRLMVVLVRMFVVVGMRVPTVDVGVAGCILAIRGLFTHLSRFNVLHRHLYP